MKQVAAVMKAWAIEKENADVQTALKWELAGLLHDADWEKYPDDHCASSLKNWNEEILTRCHSLHCQSWPDHFGVEPVNKMDKMIYAIDELSGFIHAASLFVQQV
jgi:predicted hydrolase (HD superfamily)